MNTSAYQELNLRQGACESEIKAAFRRLAKDYHPDTAKGVADTDKFRKAYKAYQSLLKNLPKNKRGRSFKLSSTPFVFEGQRNMGLDVYFDLALVRPKDDAPFTLVLPTTLFQACPRCLGQGKTLSRKQWDSNIYRAQTCPKCQGTGSIEQSAQIKVTVTSEMAERGKFRLPKAGGYQPKEARRGDLIVTLRWVSKLPSEN
ncbi:MAG: DnaJ domain-containing protein [Deltaproteobacteria bacterium]|jgi:DnaJ-class molecular chaperone|nr:DnaJ domain-containing protein [Deltaproteobacteria bacterium]